MYQRVFTEEKILFIFNAFAAQNSVLTGGDVHGVELVKYFQRKGMPISICCPRNFPCLKDFKDIKQITYPNLPFEEILYKTLPSILLVYLFRILVSIPLILRNNSSIVVSTSALLPDVVSLLFVRKKVRIVNYLHHIISEQDRRGMHSLITKNIEKINFWVLKIKKAVIITVSEKNKNTLVRKYGFIEKNVYSTKNGLDIEFIESMVPGKEKYDIVFCGRVYRTKGIYDLMDIIKIIKKSHPDIKCAVVGSGSDMESYKSSITVEGLGDNIRLFGYVTEEEKYGIMKASKVFVLPSHEEGWGIVIGEAMACRVPAIVYRLDDITGIWGDNVVWAECFDVKDFADKVVSLLENEDERRELSDKAYEFSRSLGWDSVLDRELQVIRGIPGDM